MKPPKKSRSQMKVAKAWKFFKKGIGKAERTAQTPMQHCIYYAFRVLYPPSLVVIIPLMITPETGAVKLRKE